jgi:hypothetical protein
MREYQPIRRVELTRKGRLFGSDGSVTRKDVAKYSRPCDSSTNWTLKSTAESKWPNPLRIAETPLHQHPQELCFLFIAFYPCAVLIEPYKKATPYSFCR